jgi:RNA ligase
MKDLPDLIAAKAITARRHPTEPLTIFNYTKRTQFEKNWNDTTMTCRGLIRHDDGRIVARPYRKFFNVGERADEPFPASFEIYDKLDGSLGITYREPSTGRIAIATRGSFESYQAARATKMWREKYDHVMVPDGETWLFEIIFRENVDGPVLRYDFDDLVLHGCVDIATGADLALPSSWPGPRVESFPPMTLDDLRRERDKLAEGYVLIETPRPVDRPARRLKVKLGEYMRIASLVSGATPHAVWECLRNGDDVKALLHGLPDEFYRDAEDIALALSAQVTTICADARERFARVLADTPDGDRKARALRIQQEPEIFRSYLYALLSGKPAEPIAWKNVEPVGGEVVDHG